MEIVHTKSQGSVKNIRFTQNHGNNQLIRLVQAVCIGSIYQLSPFLPAAGHPPSRVSSSSVGSGSSALGRSMPKILKDNSRSFKILRDPSRSSKILQDPSRSFQILLDPSRSLKVLQDPSRSFKILQDPSRSCNTLQDLASLFRIQRDCLFLPEQTVRFCDT